MLRIVKQLAPEGHRIQVCGTMGTGQADGATGTGTFVVQKDAPDGPWKPSLRGTIRCGHAFCPRCADIDGSIRREELLCALYNPAVVSALLITIAPPHHKFSDPSVTWDAADQARRKVLIGRPFTTMKTVVDGIAHFWTVEVSWSATNGLHPHSHILVLTSKVPTEEEIDRVADLVWQQARTGMQAFNLRPDRSEAVNVKRIETTPGWRESIASYMTSGPAKVSKNPERYGVNTLATEALATGRADMVEAYRTLLQICKGRHRFGTSRNLPSLASDGAEFCPMVEEPKPVLVHRVKPSWAQWTAVRRHNAIPEVLEAGRLHGPTGIQHLLRHLESLEPPGPDRDYEVAA